MTMGHPSRCYSERNGVEYFVHHRYFAKLSDIITRMVSNRRWSDLDFLGSRLCLSLESCEKNSLTE